MAKNIGRLAGLAALAGAAYMMSKGKDKDKEGPAATAGEEKASKARIAAQKDAVSGNKSAETRLKTPAESIAAADKSDKSTSISTKEASGTTTPGPDKSVPNLDVKPAPAPKPKPASEPKPVVTDTPSAPPAQVNRTMEDSTKQKVLDTLNQRAGANTPSALRSDQLANVSRATKREQKTKQFAQDVPYQENAAKTDAMMVASRAARKADALKKTAKKSSFKSGGMVSKVSSASSRADGIASRGKTRCKMY